MKGITVTIKQVAELALLEDSTDVLDDHDELRRRWDSDGYIFLRGVIDTGALEEVRRAYMRRLAEQGLVASVDGESLWTGAPLEADRAIRYTDLDESVWKDLVSHPSFDATIRAVLGEAPSWVPIVSYRAALPTADLADDMFVGKHQDGYFNRGINFWNIWVPLMDIPANVGGLAIAPAHHKNGFLHVDGVQSIPTERVPDELWLRADYVPGDMLIFNNLTPHSAMVNTSDVIRLSIDVRVIPESDVQPVIGVILDSDDTSLTIVEDDGTNVSLVVDDDTYFRGIGPAAQRLGPGNRVIASTDDTRTRAVVVRLAT
jgi:hypothetical protein